MKPAHILIDEAFEQHWKSVGTQGSPDHARVLSERHLNETLNQILVSSEAFHTFFPFPLKVRVVADARNPGEFVWGFMQLGDDDALDWIKTVKGDEFERHFPQERWVKLSLPRVSRNELLLALAQILKNTRGPDTDTLGALMEVGVHHYLEDRSLVALSRLIDSTGVGHGQSQ